MQWNLVRTPCPCKRAGRWPSSSGPRFTRMRSSPRSATRSARPCVCVPASSRARAGHDVHLRHDGDRTCFHARTPSSSAPQRLLPTLVIFWCRVHQRRWHKTTLSFPSRCVCTCACATPLAYCRPLAARFVSALFCLTRYLCPLLARSPPSPPTSRPPHRPHPPLVLPRTTLHALPWPSSCTRANCRSCSWAVNM